MKILRRIHHPRHHDLKARKNDETDGKERGRHHDRLGHHDEDLGKAREKRQRNEDAPRRKSNPSACRTRSQGEADVTRSRRLSHAADQATDTHTQTVRKKPLPDAGQTIRIQRLP